METFKLENGEKNERETDSSSKVFIREKCDSDLAIAVRTGASESVTHWKMVDKRLIFFFSTSVMACFVEALEFALNQSSRMVT